MKRSLSVLLILMLVFASSLAIGCAPSVSQEDYDKVIEEKDALVEENAGLLNDNDKLKDENATLTEEKATLEKEKTELQSKLDLAAPWFELSEEEQADMLVVLEERQAEREKEAAKEAQQGYETGITYDQLSRTPDDYIGKKVKFTGVVIQVIEGSGVTMLRIATSGRYNNVILVQYDSEITAVRVLEDDKVTIYGTSAGLYTYESTGSGDITIPHIKVDQIEFVTK